MEWFINFNNIPRDFKQENFTLLKDYLNWKNLQEYKKQQKKKKQEQDD